MNSKLRDMNFIFYFLNYTPATFRITINKCVIYIINIYKNR